MIVKRAAAKLVRIDDLKPGDVFRRPGLGDVYYLRGSSCGDGYDDVIQTIRLDDGSVDEEDPWTEVEPVVGAFVEGAK